MKPLYKEKVWGGQSLRKLLGKELPADRKIGELWEISDFYKDQSIVANGPLAGMSLHDAINKWGTDLLGTKVKLLDNGLFPLLIKYINANKDLSVQVHPTDAYARAHNLQQPGKTECWYVINAEPGGRLIAGFKEGVTRESFIKSIDNGTIAEQLHEIPVQTGDVLFIPAGRIHAIGAGVTLFEVQQNADITYRIYDWDRPDLNGKPRELHISQALEVCDFNDHEPKLEPQHVSYNGEEIMCPVIDCEYFTINHANVARRYNLDFDGSSFIILNVIKGTGMINNGHNPMKINCGDSILLPAALKGIMIEAMEELDLLITSVPG